MGSYQPSSYYDPGVHQSHSMYSQPYYGNGYSRYYTPHQGMDMNSSPGSIFHSLQNIVGMISSMTQFVDSTVYAGWSSITALTAVAENFKRFRDDFLKKWVQIVKKIVGFVAQLLFPKIIATRSSPEGQSRWKLTLFGVLPLILGLLVQLRRMWTAAVISDLDYISDQPGHLPIRKGESVIIIAEEDGWCYGRNQDGKEGCFPKHIVNNKAEI